MFKIGDIVRHKSCTCMNKPLLGVIERIDHICCVRVAPVIWWDSVGHIYTTRHESYTYAGIVHMEQHWELI